MNTGIKGTVKCLLLSSYFFSSTSGHHPGKMKQTPRRPCALREGLLAVTVIHEVVHSGT